MGHINFDDLHNGLPHVISDKCFQSMLRMMSLACVVFWNSAACNHSSFYESIKGGLIQEWNKHEGSISAEILSLMTRSALDFYMFSLKGNQKKCECGASLWMSEWRNVEQSRAEQGVSALTLQPECETLDIHHAKCEVYEVSFLAFWHCNINSALSLTV